MTENGYSVVEDVVECALVVRATRRTRYAYCARAARRYALRVWTVTGALARGRGALAASLRRRFSFRRGATRASRSRGRAILLASQVLNI